MLVDQKLVFAIKFFEFCKLSNVIVWQDLFHAFIGRLLPDNTIMKYKNVKNIMVDSMTFGRAI